MKQLTPASVTNHLLVIFLSLYIFLGEFIVGTTHLGILKLAFAGISVLLFLFSFFTNKIESNDIKIYLGVILIIALYLIIWGSKLGNYNLFVTIFYGYIFAKNKDITIKVLKIIFLLQFFAVFYEVLSHTFIYTEVDSGLIASNEFNFGNNVDLFDDTGFRAKGLFPGTLVATSFIIYFTLIFRNNTKLLFFNMLTAFMVNGRLAIIIATLTFLLRIFKSRKIKINNKKIPNKLIFIILIPFIIIFTSILLYFILPPTMLNNLLGTIDITSEANAGRLFRMAQGYIIYIFDYSIVQKMLGSTDYQLFDLWQRPVPPEAELAGLLLEIGFIGFLIYFFALYKIYSRKEPRFYNLNSPYLSYNYTVIINIIGILVYRHCYGNVRGAMFWFIIWIALSEIKSKKSLNSEKMSKKDL